ncbi:MAG TPA: VCBS repeat-containing protein [Planctomycetota bacterium]|nr:VCBS repeat-containing protein [Planctomycetota bacterium]
MRNRPGQKKSGLPWGARPCFALAAGFLALGGNAEGQGYLVWQVTGTSASPIPTAVSRAGDVNGDGVGDVLVASGSGTYPATVLVLSGTDGGLLYSIPWVAYVFALGAVGDVDGDGASDLLVGSPLGTYPGAPPDSGRVDLFSGANGQLLLTVIGILPGESIGFSVSGVGDVSGDGLGDFVAGAPWYYSAGYVLDIGLARVYSGADGSVLLTSVGQNTEDRLGAAVAGLGDVDGDGVPDLAVGAPQYRAYDPAGPLGPGYVRIYSGWTGALLHQLTGVFGDGFGYSVAGPGDLDGDGAGDVVVGAPGIGAYFANFTSGVARAFSGFTGSLLWAIQGASIGPYAGLGASVSSLGDVDGDGAADVAVGIPGAWCESAPGTPGIVRFCSGTGGQTIAAVAGLATTECFGRSLGGPGDANGDGFPEVLVGVGGADVGGLPDVGQARVFSYAGIPAGSSVVGSGCPGSGGTVPLITTAGGAPSAGNPAFRVFLSKALGGTTAILIAGISSFSPPIPLGGIGMPGCSLLAYPDFLFARPTTGAGPAEGRAFVPLPIPSSPSLAGAVLYFQWLVADPGPAAIPGAMSASLQLVMS